MHKVKALYLGLSFLIPFIELVFADTIRLNNGQEVKGIVVEEYKDRVVISTYKGEIAIPKSDIAGISYDLMEQNLVRLGDKYANRKEYAKAYFCYDKAFRINPDYGPAREKLFFTKKLLFDMEQRAKETLIKRRQEVEDWPSSKEFLVKDFRKALEDRVGVEIVEEENVIKIKKVLKGSPAFQAGVKKGDKLVSVWGRLTGYMSEEEIAYLLLEEGFGQVKVGIERDILVRKELPAKNYRDIIGAKLDMQRDGLTISEVKDGGPGQKAGLERGDLIVGINSDSTRYMSLKKAILMIEKNPASIIIFTIKRFTVIWRK